jgi:hypothetical protein
MKKKLLIIAIVIIVLLLAFFAWRLMFPGSSREVVDNIRNTLPFGSGDGILPTTNNLQPTTDADTDGQVFDEFGRPTVNLFRITDTPVAGSIAFTRGTTSPITMVRYVDRATGHIYEVDLDTFDKVRITNQTLPKIYEAYFSEDANSVLLRSLKAGDVIENLSLKLTPPTSTSTDALYSVEASVLRGDITEVIQGGGNSLFYVLRDTSSINTSSFNGSGSRSIYTSPFNSWRLTRSGSNLLIYTKASSGLLGYAYNLNITNGSLTKVLGPLYGLTVLPNQNGSILAYSHVEGSKIRTYTRNTQDQNLYEIIPPTLVEKCVWSSINTSTIICASPISGLTSNEPDSWYKGITSFSDRIWRIDTSIDVSELLVEPKNLLDVDIDVYNPQLSPREDYMIFQNKRDLSLWGLRL